MNENIKTQLNILPKLSGSYQFYNNVGEVIYVGKAKILKNRVSSYFNKSQDSPKLRVMVPQIEKIEFIVTDTEIEALILESHLIKKYKPKYNVLLKDDKKFPYFVITEEEYPRIIVARKRNKNHIKGRYFGPYTDSRAMYSTLDLIKKLFPLKQCNNPKFKDRPCLYYDIGKCMAPCQKLISSEEYKKIIDNVELFLTGKQNELVEHLKLSMQACAQKEQFEKAARFRDSWLDVQKTIERQKVVSENTKTNQDIIAVINEDEVFVVTLLKIRAGRLIEKKDFEFKAEQITCGGEILSSFIKEYYQLCGASEIPNTILTGEQIEKEELELLQNWLTSIAKHNIKFISQKTKINKELLALAGKNAKFYLEKIKLDKLVKLRNDYNEIGNFIKEKLKLDKFPKIVDCLDISHIQGSNTVASAVVFENGMPQKKAYKKYKIKTQEGKPDDFKSMQEVVERRYGKIIAENSDMPDLIIIDGGKGQLSSVMKIFDKLNIKNQNIVSLAKRLEEVFLPKKRNPVIFPENSNSLYFFQQIRDEAHRFAITFHRKLRSDSATESVLDEIKQLGESSKIKLFKKYKTVKAISMLTQTELETTISKRAAKAVFEFFNVNH